jgi:hypothetical protein
MGGCLHGPGPATPAGGLGSSLASGSIEAHTAEANNTDEATTAATTTTKQTSA